MTTFERAEFARAIGDAIARHPAAVACAAVALFVVFVVVQVMDYRDGKGAWK